MENIGLYFYHKKNIHGTFTLKQSHWSLLFPLTGFSRQSLDRDTMQSILQIFGLSKKNLTDERHRQVPISSVTIIIIKKI